MRRSIALLATVVVIAAGCAYTPTDVAPEIRAHAP